MSPVKLAALPLSASTNNVVKTPRPFCSVAYWSLVEAVKTVTPSASDASCPASGGVPAIPEWQLSSIISLFIGIFYFFYKLFFWETFSLGLAPVIIGIFFISSIQIVLLGLMGEYIGVILLHQRNMPLVIEKERINFDN